MPERASKSQVLQIGWESAYGTPATVNKKLLSLMLDFDAQVTRKRNFAQGYNFPSSTTKGKDWTEAGLSGAVMFDEAIVPLSMALGTAVITTLTPATAKQWVWTVPLSGDIVPKSTTIEKGDANTAETVSGAILRELGFEWDRDEISISGAMLAQNLDETHTLTGAAVALPQVPLDPAGIGIWLDTTSAGLGGTRMLRVFDGGVSLGSLYNGIWPLNETKPSFDGIISTVPESDTTLGIMADAAGKALLTSLKAGDRRFLRWAVKGPMIGVGPATHLLQFDMAVEIVDVDAFADDDGIYTIPLTLAPMADEAWAKALVVTLVNTQAAY